VPIILKGEGMIHCFNYYYQHKNKFIKILADAITIADPENFRRLKDIYLAPCTAKLSTSFDIIPPVLINVEYPEITNNEKIEKREYERKKSLLIDKHINPGSFAWHLQYSGNFVTLMAKLIVEADLRNKSLISKSYPQMVAAYDLEDWSVPPKNFDVNYLSKGKSQQSTYGGLGGFTMHTTGFGGYTGVSGVAGISGFSGWGQAV
jgi:hypothetical protein